MRFKLLVWVPVFGLCAGALHAKAYVEMPAPDGENISYAYADVLRANPTYEVVQMPGAVEECSAAAVDSDAPDDGEPTHVLTLGAAAADWRECDVADGGHEERRIIGYEVEYRYKGQVYMSHMGYDPGNKLRIRITIAPAD